MTNFVIVIFHYGEDTKEKFKKIQLQHLVEVNIPFGILSVFCSWKKSWVLRELSLLRRERAEM